MEKEQAQRIAIEFAKVAISSAASPFYFNEKGANDIANFIETLTKRLVSQ